MHNLSANITKFRQLLIIVYGADNLKDGNFINYSNLPKAYDIEIVATAFASEAMGIISENLLFSIFKLDFPAHNKTIPDLSNYNRRRRK